MAPQIVALGEELEFTLVASNADEGTTLTYSVENLPEGATLDSETGTFKWQPSPGQVGDYVVTYTVSDGEDTVEKNAIIRVEVEPTLPVVNAEFSPSFPVVPGQKIFINALADSFTEIETVSISVNGEELILDERNRAEYIPNTTGRVEVSVTATDVAKRTATTTEILKVHDPEDNDAPIVAFGLGLNGEAFSSETNIIATVGDRNLDEWTLELKEGGTRSEEQGEVLAAGYGVVNNDSNEEDYQVLLAPGALSEETIVNIESLSLDSLELPVPEFLSSIGAFELDLGAESSKLPIQFAFPTPQNHGEKDLVFVLGEGDLPDPETGKWSPGWLIEDIATIDSDGMLRTGTQTRKMPGSYGGNGKNKYLLASITVPDEIYDLVVNSDNTDATVASNDLTAPLFGDALASSTETEIEGFTASNLSASLLSDNFSNNNPIPLEDNYIVNEDNFLQRFAGLRGTVAAVSEPIA